MAHGLSCAMTCGSSWTMDQTVSPALDCEPLDPKHRPPPFFLILAFVMELALDIIHGP